MKKSRRMTAFNQLLAEAQSRDFDEREFALLQIALVMEQSNLVDHTRTPDIYADNLSRELLGLKLDAADQEQVVAQLVRMIAASSHNRETLYWALGKARADIGLPALLGLLKAQGKQLDDESAYQVVLALEGFIKEMAVERRTEYIRMNDPAPLLKKWLKSSDDRLASIAGRLLERLQA